MNNDPNRLMVVITSDNFPAISTFFCTNDDMDYVKELAQKRIAAMEQTEHPYINLRIEVREHLADL